MDKLKLYVQFAPTYLVGVLCYLYRKVTEEIGITKFYGLENFPKTKKRVFVASNHPSLLEPQLLVTLFGPEYLTHPLQFGPWSVADKGNYVNSWYGPFICERIIAIDRGTKKGNLEAVKKFIRILSGDGNIIGFLEGTRTESDKPGERVVSLHGHLLRKLHLPLLIVAARAEATIVPVWCVRGSGLQLEVYIGKPLEIFPGEDVKALGLRLEEELLILADSAFGTRHAKV